METSTVLGWVGVGFGFLGLMGAAFCADELNKTRKMLGVATGKISEMSQVDIDKALVDDLVKKAVQTKAGEVVRNAAQSVKDDVTADIRNRVKQSVSGFAGEINKKVAKQIADEMSHVDRDEIVDEVIKRTTEKLVDKLGEDLDNEVGRIGKIYKGIAAALQ